MGAGQVFLHDVCLVPGPTGPLKVVEMDSESGSRGLPGPVVISTLKRQRDIHVLSRPATMGPTMPLQRFSPLSCRLGVG